MADTPAPNLGALTVLVKMLAPYAPGFAGAVFSMAFGEKLTIRGKLLSAAVGVASVIFVAPLICDLGALWWPGDRLPNSAVGFVGFVSGLFGMILLAGLAQAIAKYSRDPLSLVRIQIGGAVIGGPGEDGA